MIMLAERLTEQTAIPFVRDVWVKQPEGNYGTVQVAGDRVFWADNRPVKRVTTYDVHLFSPDTGDTEAATVEAALTDVPHMRTWRLVSAELLTDPLLMRRRWQIVVEERMQNGV